MSEVIICQWCHARCYREEGYMAHECVTSYDYPDPRDYCDTMHLDEREE